MTLGFTAFTLGLILIYTSVKNMTVADLLLNRPGTQPDSILAGAGLSLDAATGGAAGGSGKVKAGGAYGGAKGIVDGLTKGLPGGSTKRSTKGTADGGVSDHWTGCKLCYAKDSMVGSLAEGDKVAATIAQRAGRPDWKGGSWLEVEIDGFRVQVGWRVRDHFDHVHTGARKLGYMPS